MFMPKHSVNVAVWREINWTATSSGQLDDTT